MCVCVREMESERMPFKEIDRHREERKKLEKDDDDDVLHQFSDDLFIYFSVSLFLRVSLSCVYS